MPGKHSHWLARRIETAEQARAERTKGHRAETLVSNQAEHLSLKRPVQEAVGVLNGHEWIGAQSVPGPQGPAYLPGFEVADADVADLARGHKIVQGPYRFLDGRFFVE